MTTRRCGDKYREDSSYTSEYPLYSLTRHYSKPRPSFLDTSSKTSHARSSSSKHGQHGKLRPLPDDSRDVGSSHGVVEFPDKSVGDSNLLLERWATYMEVRGKERKLGGRIAIHRLNELVDGQQEIKEKFKRTLDFKLRTRQHDLKKRQAQFMADVKLFSQRQDDKMKLDASLWTWAKREVKESRQLTHKMKDLKELLPVTEEYVDTLKLMVQRYELYNTFMRKCTAAMFMSRPSDLTDRHKLLMSILKENIADVHGALLKSDLLMRQLGELREERERRKIQGSQRIMEMEKQLKELRLENKQREDDLDHMNRKAAPSTKMLYRVEMKTRDVYQKVRTLYSKKFEETDDPLEQLNVIKRGIKKLQDKVIRIANQCKEKYLRILAEKADIQRQDGPGESEIQMNQENLVEKSKRKERQKDKKPAINSAQKHRKAEKSNLQAVQKPRKNEKTTILDQKLKPKVDARTKHTKRYLNRGLILPNIYSSDFSDETLSQRLGIDLKIGEMK